MLELLHFSDVFDVAKKVSLAHFLQFFEGALGGAQASPFFLGVLLELGANISHVLALGDALEELTQFVELPVLWIPNPSHDFDAVFGLTLEVVTDIVYDYGFAEIASQQAQIFHEDAIIELAVVAVKSMIDVLIRAI